jgi:hypothetical protein
MKVSRRTFLESSAVTAAAAAQQAGVVVRDGPASANFRPVPLEGNITFAALGSAGVSEDMAKAASQAPAGETVSWGIPFRIGRPVLLQDKPVTEKTGGLKAQWLVFLHATDTKPLAPGSAGLIQPMRGEGFLGEHVADYILVYADGAEVKQEIRRRHQVGMLRRRWGENCFQAVAQRKPHALRPVHEQPSMLVDAGGGLGWGQGETRVQNPDQAPWMNWLWAWENPHPEKEIAAIRFEPKQAGLVISAVSAGNASAHPLRWNTRRKAILELPEGSEFDYRIDRFGQWKQVQLDMGQIISAQPRPLYPNDTWPKTYNNQVPELSRREVLIEYTAHPDARFHLQGAAPVPASQLEARRAGPLISVKAASRRVTLRVLDQASRKLVPVKLHLHGESGEYLAPVDRHRQPNIAWFEDYSPEFQHQGRHRSVYIDGETVADLPPGRVYLEVSKGFEIRPVRKAVEITPSTETVEVLLEKVLPWRERGWVTADTHVHFLSPPTALLEGAAEGVNVVNLLASQWGELMTNVGDFDGRTTFGAKESGGDGEWLVRVGTENRQHVLGHISLLGYKGRIIAPMCSGGPNEAAIGDAIEVLLMEWAERCRAQGGISVLPHFPNPRAENAAGLIVGVIDAVEMTSWGNLYAGIDPYSLSDYYRYLNCGHRIAAVGGTDKMSATTAVGTVRTYAKIPAGRPFTYDAWLEAIRSLHTFVTYGPLMEFAVEGKPPGAELSMPSGGGSVAVTWDLASVTIPMTRVELVVNGEIRESRELKPDKDSGHFQARVEGSSWLALLVRGRYAGQPEMIAAHSSPVFARVTGSEFFSAPDAVTMLEQIEGALAYIDTVGTRAQDEVYKRIRLKLTSVYRQLHNDLHRRGHYHAHTPVTEHS